MSYFFNQRTSFNLSDNLYLQFSSTESGAVLGAHDIVGSTFFIAMNMMLAFTVFFLLERNAVPVQWKRSVTVAMLVTGIAYRYNTCFCGESDAADENILSRVLSSRSSTHVV